MRRDPVITIPDPCLVVLIGAAGAGKSTFAARWFEPDEVLSSDDLRALIAGDAADQRATGPAFEALHRMLGVRLGAGLLTVVDATSVQARARRALLERAAEAGMPAVAIVLDMPPAVVLARNTGRGARIVPVAAVRRQLGDLRRAPDDRLRHEGFALVVRLTHPAELDTATVVRSQR